MAVTYGFYDSLNHDRLYNAQQMSAIFDGIINDGVFMSVGNQLHTVAGTGMQIIVKSGRAWFDSTWTLNDAEYPLSIDAADVLLTRIDAVVLEVNSEVATRANTIKVVKGTPASTPAKPTLTNTATIHQHALAYVTVAKNTTAITNSMIEIVVGKTETPYVTAILQTTDITDLFNKWENDFQVWFETVKGTLDGDVALNLQNQIDHCVKKADKATSADIEAGTADKWVDASAINKTVEPIGSIRYLSSNIKNNDDRYILCNGKSVIEKTAALYEAYKNENIPFVLDYDLTKLSTTDSTMGGMVYYGRSKYYHICYTSEIETKQIKFEYSDETQTTTWRFIKHIFTIKEYTIDGIYSSDYVYSFTIKDTISDSPYNPNTSLPNWAGNNSFETSRLHVYEDGSIVYHAIDKTVTDSQGRGYNGYCIYDCYMNIFNNFSFCGKYSLTYNFNTDVTMSHVYNNKQLLVGMYIYEINLASKTHTIFGSSITNSGNWSDLYTTEMLSSAVFNNDLSSLMLISIISNDIDLERKVVKFNYTDHTITESTNYYNNIPSYNIIPYNNALYFIWTNNGGITYRNNSTNNTDVIITNFNYDYLPMHYWRVIKYNNKYYGWYKDKTTYVLKEVNSKLFSLTDFANYTDDATPVITISNSIPSNLKYPRTIMLPNDDIIVLSSNATLYPKSYDPVYLVPLIDSGTTANAYIKINK